MSNIQYGLISKIDAATLEKTIDLICDEFKDEVINILELGVYGGRTGRGLVEYVMNNKSRNIFIAGIDNGKDGEEIRFKHIYDKLIIGNSNEVYNQLEDNSQHLILVDADHTLIGTISDFYAYADKVKVGGYFAFHDTGKHIAKFKDFQHGDKDNPDAYISVRKALWKIGLFDNLNKTFLFNNKKNTSIEIKNTLRQPNWGLIFDEADETDLAGGLTVFKKLKLY